MIWAFIAAAVTGGIAVTAYALGPAAEAGRIGASAMN